MTMCGLGWTNVGLSAYVNGVTCDNATQLIDDSLPCESLLTCTLPIGAGADQLVTVSAARQFSPAAKLLSYSAPNITQLIGCASSSGLEQVVGCNRFGGDILTLM